jgi:dipeptidyl aminopeptidase/acylaminoacyl peptidase
VRGASLTEQVKMWTESVSPIEEAEKVNVPLLLVHGTVDQRVPLVHSLRYRKELDKYGKDYKFVELVGADHFYSTLFYDHQIKLYESMIDFLHNDCGPGGL